MSAQLRGIDPQRPALRRATAVLPRSIRRWAVLLLDAGRRSPSGPPASLVGLQAELAETHAAAFRGAQRVTVTMADGLQVQAIFGDASGADDDLPTRCRT